MPLTKLLGGSVCTPGQLQCEVNVATLIDGSTIRLQGDTWTGRFWDDGNVLGGIRFRLSEIKSLKPSEAYMRQ